MGSTRPGVPVAARRPPEDRPGDGGRVAFRVVRLEDVHVLPGRSSPPLDPAALELLCASIAELGVLEPLFVRLRPAGGYELLAGHRRWHAARALRLAVVPVVVRDIDDAAVARLVGLSETRVATAAGRPVALADASGLELEAPVDPTWGRRKPTVISGPGMPPLVPAAAPALPRSERAGLRLLPRLGPLFRRNRN